MTRKPSLQEQFIGTILGVAVGDALGAPVEGWSRETIKSVLGYLRGYQLTMVGKGIYTDDTQLTLELLKSLVNSRGFDPGDFGWRIGEWMRRNDEGIESARGVGKTISLAARKIYRGIPWDQSGEYSASNGAAVRVAPLALLHYQDDDVNQLMADIENSARPTHIETLAIQGAKVVGLAIHRILREERFFFDRVSFLENLIVLSEEHAPKLVGCLISLRKYIGKAIESKVFDPPCPKPAYNLSRKTEALDDRYVALSEIGSGKYVLESIPAALFCFLSTPMSFEDTLLTAINAGGDTDSIAAIAGSLSGALNGAAAIPMRWLMDLENKDFIINLTMRLYDKVLGLEIPEGAIFISNEKLGIKS